MVAEFEAYTRLEGSNKTKQLTFSTTAVIMCTTLLNTQKFWILHHTEEVSYYKQHKRRVFP